jgi:Zn-dependent peptidase ImmA (M78 family)
MYSPDWYGQRYPTELDLVSCAEAIGARVVLGPLPAAAFIPAILDAPPMILVPNQHGPMATAWGLAHELGHLCQHSGPPLPTDGDRAPGLRLMRSKNEHQADRWAACALIPEARIRHHGNASLDSFMAALSANYEDLPPHDCPQRALAHKVALRRLEALKAKGEPGF